jgi:hypothetical protein
MMQTVCLIAAPFTDPIAPVAARALEAPRHIVALQAQRDVVGWMRRPDVFALVVTARTVPDARRSSRIVRLARAMAPETPIVAVLDAPTPDTALTLMLARAGADHFVFAPAQELAPILRGAARGPAAGSPQHELPAVFRQRFASCAVIDGAQALAVVSAAWRAPARATVADLARTCAQSATQLRRTCTNLGLPRPMRILEWARLVRGAQAAGAALASGEIAELALVAEAAGFQRVQNADRAYRMRAGVPLAVVQHRGEQALARGPLHRDGRPDRASVA